MYHVSFVTEPVELKSTLKFNHELTGTCVSHRRLSHAITDWRYKGWEMGATAGREEQRNTEIRVWKDASTHSVVRQCLWIMVSCRTYVFMIFTRSGSASRQWMTSGTPSLSANRSCFLKTSFCKSWSVAPNLWRTTRRSSYNRYLPASVQILQRAKRSHEWIS